MIRTRLVSVFPFARKFSRWLLLVLATLALFFYFVQYSRLPPNSVDGALILGYLEEMSYGGLPYWDFIDVYGPLNWVFPTLFYTWAGRAAWGVRIWILILKLLSVGMTYRLVSRLANRFYAVLAVCWMTALLGQPWQFMQTPYACHTALPLLLWAWYLLLTPPAGTRALSLILAGGITAVVLWIKVSTGLFLLAGGLFCCFYWIPGPDRASGTGDQGPEQGRFQKWFRLAQIVGLVAYAAAFGVFMREYFDFMYFLYLGAPLAVTLIWTQREIVRRWRAELPFGHHLRYWLAYLMATALGWLVFFLGYYGWEAGWDCLAQVTAILTAVDYMDPFPALGAKGHYVGFNEYYWLQLPWLLGLFFFAWIALQHRRRISIAASAHESESRFQITGVWALAMFNTFVVYPRSDEAHVIQAVIPAVPPVFVLLCRLEQLLLGARSVLAKTALEAPTEPQRTPLAVLDQGSPGRRPSLWNRTAGVVAGWRNPREQLRSLIRRKRVLFRGGVSLAVLFLASTIAVMPSLRVFRLDQGDWFSDRLRYLKFRSLYNPAVRNTSTDITDFHWDMAINYAGVSINRLTDNDAEILTLTNNELIAYHANTRPVGGRYRYLFYLLKNDLLDRERFEALVPPDTIQRLLDHPPPLIVGDVHTPPLVWHYPEFGKLVKDRYRLVNKFAHIFIYVRNDTLEDEGDSG